MPEGYEQEPLPKAEESPLNITVKLLSGDVAWGPTKVARTQPIRTLRSQIAEALGKDTIQLGFVNSDGGLLDLSSRTKSVGSLDPTSYGKVEMTLAVKDFETSKMQEIHLAMKSAPGLTEDEITALEKKYAFLFPPDLRVFLQFGVPPKFYDFHKLAKEDVTVGSEADAITDALKYEATPEDAYQAEAARKYPLIPIFGSRMMASLPCKSGLPVFSMHGCHDNICYGRNLWCYLEADEHIEKGIIPNEWKDKSQWLPKADVPFWPDLVEIEQSSEASPEPSDDDDDCAFDEECLL